MYKNSHRRTIECLPAALAIVPVDEINYFNEKWEMALDTKSNSLKSLCRKYIIRLLLNHAQQTKYLDKLICYDIPIENENRDLKNMKAVIKVNLARDDKNTYARKIATMLHGYSNRCGNEQYISFPRLIKTILQPPFLPSSINDKQINNLSKIIYLMNESSNHITNWTSLICLKFHKREYSEDKLFIAMKQQWNDYNNGEIDIDDSSKFGVRITKAGRFFAKILPDFEYFACRFLYSEPPLFSKTNLKSIEIDKKRIFRSIAIIKVVRKIATSWIEDIIERDIQFISSLANNTDKKNDFGPMFTNEYTWVYQEQENTSFRTHPLRIFEQHIGYIKSYADFVDKFVNKNEFEKQEEDKSQMLRLIKNELKLYKEKFKKLKKKHKDYFINYKSNKNI
jgi:hypothetical protein